ncbi:MAG: WYL domain-containing protein [Clostridiales bacterium]|nr:WYL domain-containing protein [Clostridiales bacterium]
MPKQNWQKIKLLKLVDLLRQETDEQHPLTTTQICERMNDMGIPCDRRILSKDIELLNENGIEVLWTWVGKCKGYYTEDRTFSVPELKILIDAVQAAAFVTDKKTEELVDKLAGMGGTNRAEILKSNLAHFNTRKHSNESIYYNVDAIEDALQRQRKIIFRYFDLDIKGKKRYRRDGHHYVVEPVALVYNEDNYYIVVYSERHDDTANYRVDRMDSVEVIEESISEKAVTLKDRVGEYTEQAIKMYGGEPQTVVLEFDSKLTGVIYDRFGEGVNMMPSSEDKMLATVRVQLSPTFWGWLFQFGAKMRVLSPSSVTEEYRARVAELQL